MRLYTFTNANYLKEIQCGIQTAHVVHSLFNRYAEREQDLKLVETAHLWNWSKHYKTIIILDGGNCENLHNIYSAIMPLAEECSFPYVCFHEDKASLNDAITCVGVILPASVYEPPITSLDAYLKLLPSPLTTADKLYNLIRSYRLA